MLRIIKFILKIILESIFLIISLVVGIIVGIVIGVLAWNEGIDKFDNLMKLKKEKNESI
jgi:uncharacterized membrane-anchored protein YhcB (DUF1043 family)